MDFPGNSSEQGMADQDRKRTVYETVAGRIEAMIARNTLLPGDKVPSLRRMHLDTGASVTSVLQAYTLLESRGLIEARPQSGFYVSARRALPSPEPRPAVFQEE